MQIFGNHRQKKRKLIFFSHIFQSILILWICHIENIPSIWWFSGIFCHLFATFFQFAILLMFSYYASFIHSIYIIFCEVCIFLYIEYRVASIINMELLLGYFFLLLLCFLFEFSIRLLFAFPQKMENVCYFWNIGKNWMKNTCMECVLIILFFTLLIWICFSLDWIEMNKKIEQIWLCIFENKVENYWI